MCDTLGRIGTAGAFFAKNSDRSPNEIQLLEYHPPMVHKSGKVNCTYISIDQVRETYAVLLSRPDWMWGAEMGVNEHGLCIGNEAVFTKGAYGKTGLTGMDMVRLALERCKGAQEALHLLITLLESHGQGGNCGYDHDFYYDNAFLIMDRKDLFVLETAGKRWVYKRYEAANISNRLSIGSDGDAYSGAEAVDFCKKYTEPVYTGFSASAKRARQIESCLPKADTLNGAMDALSSHDASVTNPFLRGCVSSACMHYGGMVGDHSTASMVVSLEKDRTVVWSTGCSTPCVSLFKPWCFGSAPVMPVTGRDDPMGRAYWLEAEAFRRSLIGKQIPQSFYVERREIQQRWIEEAYETADADFGAFSERCLRQERAFYEKWKKYPFEEAACSAGFRRRWEQKSKVLLHR